MKIKHKILLQFIFLIALVSGSIMFAMIKLSAQGRQDMFAGVAEKLLELQQLSITEMDNARQVADSGITDASGLAAIDQVTKITFDHQKQFYQTVQEKINAAGRDISATLETQNNAVEESLDQLLAEATDAVSRIMQLDSDSFSVIASVSLSNVHYLQSAGLEGLMRFKVQQEQYRKELARLGDENNFRVDELLIDLLVREDGSSRDTDWLVDRFAATKEDLRRRQEEYIDTVFATLDQQKRILTEEVNLAADNVRWAIESERENIAAIQTGQIESVIENLLMAQAELRTRVDDSAALVRKTIDRLENDLPVELRRMGEQTNAIINEQIMRTKADTAGTQVEVAKRIEENSKKAEVVFTRAIEQTGAVIENSFSDSLEKSAKLSLVITLVCGIVAVGLGFVMIRSLTRPISRVLYFADRLSKGDLSERLPESSDEMGEMGRALNRMADELEKLQDATVNSFTQTLDQVIDCVFMFDPRTLQFIYVNQGAVEHLGYEREELLAMTPLDIKPEFTRESFLQMIEKLRDPNRESYTFTTVHRDKKRRDIPVEVLLKYVVPPGNDPRFVTIVRDISERIKAHKEKEQIQAELMQVHKLESVGQLAAGIAHEINTPTQFIGTNIEFLADTFADVGQFMQRVEKLMQKWPEECRQQLTEELEVLDWDYLQEEIPDALSQSREGVDRVSSLVAAMKRFSHPGTSQKTDCDLHEIISTALTVSRNEWKYVADVDTDFDPSLNLVPLHPDQMGQVIVNMVVNGAQAIEEKRQTSGSEDKGVITIATRVVGETVELTIKDTGMGIKSDHLKRVFDPFFTTKPVGKGTGQGLAICYDVITQKHHGTLRVESEPGVGTTFIANLPLHDNEAEKREFPHTVSC